MFNPFNKFSNPVKRFKVEPGIINKLNEHKTMLVEEVKVLKKEKRNLTRKINENKKMLEKSESLSESIHSLEERKLQLEKDIAKLYKATELTLNIKDLEKKVFLLKSEVETLEETRNKTEKDLNDLKENKALLINEIDNLNMNKDEISDNNLFSIEYIDSLKDGLAFENYFAKLLDKLGFYDIKITNGSGDFGIDVLASNDNILYGFQCKLYSSAVGNAAIQEAYSGKTHYNCNVAVVVTNNYFTEQACVQAKETRVLLWDRKTLIKKLQEANKIDFTIKM